MAENKKMVQTTLRVEAETLYQARMALNLKGLSVAKFLVQALETVVQQYRDEQVVRRIPPRADG